MAADAFLSALIRANLVAGAAIVLVLALRASIRRLAGSRAAYTLWIIPPLATLASVLPVRVVEVMAPPAPILARSFSLAAAPTVQASAIATSHAAALDWREGVLLVWAIGAAIGLVHLIVSHRAAVRRLGRMTPPSRGVVRAETSVVGPAVIGLLSPRIVVPPDFEARFEEGERAMVLAHERAHLKGGHLLAKTAAQVLARLNWVNPLAWLAAQELAADQEQACDETVVDAHPNDRRAYASALLKTQPGSALPLGCAWPSRSARLLKARVRRVGGPLRGAWMRAAGIAAAGLAALGASVAVWAAQPPVVRLAQATAPAPAASPAPAPTDPLADLARDATAILNVGTAPRLLLSETANGVAAPRTLKIGDEYRDGWKVIAIGAGSVTLQKDKDRRTVILTGRDQVAAAPLPDAAASIAASNAVVGGQKALALAAAIAAGDVRQTMILGGSAMDVAEAFAARGGPLADFLAKGATADFVNLDGRTGVSLTSTAPRDPTQPGTRIAEIFPPEIADLAPPSDATVTHLADGVSLSPSGGAVFDNPNLGNSNANADTGVNFLRSIPMPPGPRPTYVPPAVASANLTEALQSGATAPEVARVMAANNGGPPTLRNGSQADPSTAMFVQYNGALAILMSGGGGGPGGQILLFPPEVKAYVPPGGLSSLPLSPQVGGPASAPAPP